MIYIEAIEPAATVNKDHQRRRLSSIRRPQQTILQWVIAVGNFSLGLSGRQRKDLLEINVFFDRRVLLGAEVSADNSRASDDNETASQQTNDDSHIHIFTLSMS